MWAFPSYGFGVKVQLEDPKKKDLHDFGTWLMWVCVGSPFSELSEALHPLAAKTLFLRKPNPRVFHDALKMYKCMNSGTRGLVQLQDRFSIQKPSSPNPKPMCVNMNFRCCSRRGKPSLDSCEVPSQQHAIVWKVETEPNRSLVQGHASHASGSRAADCSQNGRHHSDKTIACKPEEPACKNPGVT